MKSRTAAAHPEGFSQGFEAIMCDTRVVPDTVYGDYFSSWEGVRRTHTALNKIGFYQVISRRTHTALSKLGIYQVTFVL